MPSAAATAETCTYHLAYKDSTELRSEQFLFQSALFLIPLCWSTSTRLAACTTTQKHAKLVEELVPAPYHRYLPMFLKSAT
ncbi:hypothetical protein VP01_5485g1 [Puccinia sorghi]|uniref:Uncharacterized protein n=1 Tax=Puccinia sorghi TaxID=27349 RepID=A0A0L6UJH1_9BASI|nr:hypothetical protein VP01_5485g1 [Puccinia sorghi]